MSPKLSAVRQPRPDNDWDQFRPARDLQVARRQRRQPRIAFALVLIIALFVAVLVAFRFRLQVENAVANVTKAILESRRPAPVAPPRRTVETRSLHPRRKLRNLTPERRSSGASALGPFDAYVLDGDRYIRVEGMSKYALLDTRNGKIIWIREPR